MLANAQAQRLVAETKFATSMGIGNLLPVNNNKCFLDVNGVTTVSVAEEDSTNGMKPVAFGLFNRCTSNQLYCSLVVTSPSYKGVYVDIEHVKTKNAFFGVTEENQNHHLFKICKVLKELPDLSGLPQYYSAFMDPVARPLLQTVVDELIEKSVGHLNFESSRNVTVDLYDATNGVDAEEDKLWRDFSGFIVTDRNRFAHIEIERTKFLEIIKSAFEVSGAETRKTAEGVPYRIEALSSANTEHCINYDQNIALAVNRQDYLDYLFQLYDLKGTVAIDEQNEPLGYVISLDNNILQCYAEEQQIANQLLIEHVSGNAFPNAASLALFVRASTENTASKSAWLGDALARAASRTKRVRRFHSRVVPGNMKWGKIFALNMGVHVF